MSKVAINAIRLHPDDNVAVIVVDVDAGDPIVLSDGGDLRVHAAERIGYGHKVALRPIKINEPVVKYGEHMGIATADIAVGAHVHVHNVRGLETSERGVAS